MIQFAEEFRAVEAADSERAAIGEVNAALAHASVTDHRSAFLIGPEGEQHELPESLFRILRQAAILLSRGERVVIAPIDKEVSTQEAADLLNVSRPYLVSLLDHGDIPSTKTGRYRRVQFGDVLAYKEQRNRKRRDVLATMMRENRQAGVYDEPDGGIPETR